MNDNVEPFDDLVYFFQGGEAEYEDEILDDVFVTPDNISRILDFSFKKHQIIVAQKGVGKTALMNALERQLLSSEYIALTIDPEKLNCSTIPTGSTYSDVLGEVKRQICIQIAVEIRKSIKLAKIGDEEKIVKFVDASEHGSPDWFSQLALILTELPPTTAGKISKAILANRNAPISKKILESTINSYLKNNTKRILILLDDVEKAAINKTTGINYEISWAIIDAIIEITGKSKCINACLSIRKDVWHTITESKRLHLEKIGKMNDPIELISSEEEIKKYWLHRLRLARARLFGDDDNRDPILVFFETDSVEMPGLSERSYLWSRWIAKSSRNRPRDMVNLMQMLIDEAKRDGKTRITSSHARAIMNKFSSSRMDVLNGEYLAYCDSLKKCIDFMATRSNSCEYTYDDLISVLKRAPSSEQIKIDGCVLAGDRDDSGRKILRLLHMANFVNPRVACKADTNHPLGYRHLSFEERPNFYSDSNISEAQANLHSIHSTFHQYVINMYNENQEKERYKRERSNIEKTRILAAKSRENRHRK